MFKQDYLPLRVWFLLWAAG